MKLGLVFGDQTQAAAAKPNRFLLVVRLLEEGQLVFKHFPAEVFFGQKLVRQAFKQTLGFLVQAFPSLPFFG